MWLMLVILVMLVMLVMLMMLLMLLINVCVIAAAEATSFSSLLWNICILPIATTILTISEEDWSLFIGIYASLNVRCWNKVAAMRPVLIKRRPKGAETTSSSAIGLDMQQILLPSLTKICIFFKSCLEIRYQSCSVVKPMTLIVFLRELGRTICWQMIFSCGRFASMRRPRFG